MTNGASDKELSPQLHPGSDRGDQEVFRLCEGNSTEDQRWQPDQGGYGGLCCSDRQCGKPAQWLGVPDGCEL